MVQSQYRYVYHVLKPILSTTATSSTRQGSCRNARASTTLRLYMSNIEHVQNNRLGLPFCQDLPEPLKLYNVPHTSLLNIERQINWVATKVSSDIIHGISVCSNRKRSKRYPNEQLVLSVGVDTLTCSVFHRYFKALGGLNHLHVLNLSARGPSKSNVHRRQILTPKDGPSTKIIENV